MSAAPPGVVDGLGTIAEWRAAAEEALAAERARLEDALREARSRLEEAEQHVERLEQASHLAEAGLQQLDDEETQRIRDAVSSGLMVDAALLTTRSAALRRAVHRRALDAAGLSAVEAGPLDGLDMDRAPPAASGGAGADHAARLLPHLLAAEREPGVLDVPLAAIAAVASVELEDGLPTAMAVVLPVPWTVYAEPSRHGDDLCARLAWRVVAALGVALRDVGAADAPVRPVSEDGRLSFQVWLADSELLGSVKDAVTSGIDQIHEQAHELRAAGLELYIAWLDPEILAPPEDRHDA